MGRWVFFLFCVIFSCTTSSITCAQIMKVSGSSTVTNYTFKPEHVQDIKAATGIDFEIITSSSGRGLMALMNGEADIAMISSDMETLAEKIEEKHNISIDREAYNIHKIEETKIDFIVHPQNPIREITKEQAASLLKGDITDWSMLGIDADLGPVKIVTEHTSGGMFALAEKKLLPDSKITDDKVSMQNAPQVAIIVSQVPGSFGFISAATPLSQRQSSVVLTLSDFELIQTMYFVTKKDKETEDMLRFIQHIQNKHTP